jgi:ketosteroid isomerase-like protein
MTQRTTTMSIRRFALFAIVAWGTFMAPALPAHEPDAEETALGSLVDAELAFARLGRERGIQAAFLANFADDGVALQPAPVRIHDAWSARPAPADPLAVHLDWTPAQAGVARSHDFGYTTGPYTLSSATRRGTRHGVFFSVWQRDAGGTWKVILDAGIATPSAVDFVALGPAPRPSFKGSANLTSTLRLLLAQEANAFGAGPSGLTPNHYAKLLSVDARLQRMGAPPLVSRGAIAREVAQRMRQVRWTPTDARVAKSGDMAVTYGRYQETDRASSVHDGYYAHLWLRDAAGEWRLAYDIALPAS